MNYFKQTHSLTLWLSFLISSCIFILWPSIDIQTSQLFFNNGFYMKGSWWEDLLYYSVRPFLISVLATLVVLWLFNKFTHKNLLGINGKKVAFFTLVLVIGSGIIVHLVLKNNFNRPRPIHIEEFNNNRIFTPAFVITEGKNINYSFSSGHSSAAFSALALALLFKHRKAALMLAFTYGSLVSLARIAAGGHFLSDTVVSFFIMAIITDIFYYMLFVRHQDKN